MRIHAHFRIRWHVQNLVRRLKRFAVTVLVLTVLAASLVIAKSVFLSGLSQEIQKSLHYDSLRMTYFPPAIVLEKVRSNGGSPLIKIRRVRVELPFLSLLRNEKSVVVLIEGPEVVTAGRSVVAANR